MKFEDIYGRYDKRELSTENAAKNIRLLWIRGSRTSKFFFAKQALLAQGLTTCLFPMSYID